MNIIFKAGELHNFWGKKIILLVLGLRWFFQMLIFHLVGIARELYWRSLQSEFIFFLFYLRIYNIGTLVQKL